MCHAYQNRALHPQWSARLQKLEDLTVSPEYAGAVAELEMTRRLQRNLPDTYTVFTDVAIEMDEWFFADGENRRSAQIDHAVVGPSGVFVIEVKLWSAAFSDRGDYYNPFTQVRWAGRLCHFLLKAQLHRSIKVREIIATSGRLPPKPAGSFAKVQRPHEVAGYIEWFKPELDPSTVQQIVDVLRRRC